MATLLYSNLFSTAVPGRPLSPRPYNALEAIDGDCCSATLTTALEGDAAGVIELIPVPLHKQLVKVEMTWGRADTNGTPLLAANLLLRLTDKLGVNYDSFIVGLTPTLLGAAQATPYGVLIPLLPAAQATASVAGSIQCGMGVTGGPAQGFGRIVLQNTAAAATAAQVTFTLYATWK